MSKSKKLIVEKSVPLSKIITGPVCFSYNLKSDGSCFVRFETELCQDVSLKLLFQGGKVVLKKVPDFNNYFLDFCFIVCLKGGRQKIRVSYERGV